jgi:hypothetical protein
MFSRGVARQENLTRNKSPNEVPRAIESSHSIELNLWGMYLPNKLSFGLVACLGLLGFEFCSKRADGGAAADLCLAESIETGGIATRLGHLRFS